MDEHFLYKFYLNNQDNFKQLMKELKKKKEIEYAADLDYFAEFLNENIQNKLKEIDDKTLSLLLDFSIEKKINVFSDFLSFYIVFYRCPSTNREQSLQKFINIY